jgi:hypothetical protein
MHTAAGTAQPGTTQPGAVQPGTGQPGTVQPGAAQRGAAKPGAGQRRAADAEVAFRRADASAVIDMVRAVAEARDAGEYGDGVEVVITAPRLGWFGRLFRDRTPDLARIVVTKAGGAVGYPFDVQIVSQYGGRAAHLVDAAPGWATSDSAGLAFLVQKGRPGARPDWGGLVAGAVAGLSALHKLPDKGWRARVDRAVRRA